MLCQEIFGSLYLTSIICGSDHTSSEMSAPVALTVPYSFGDEGGVAANHRDI